VSAIDAIGAVDLLISWQSTYCFGGTPAHLRRAAHTPSAASPAAIMRRIDKCDVAAAPRHRTGMRLIGGAYRRQSAPHAIGQAKAA